MFEKWPNIVQTMPITMDIAHPYPRPAVQRDQHKNVVF